MAADASCVTGGTPSSRRLEVPLSSGADIPAALKDQAEKYAAELGALDLPRVRKEAEAEVDAIIAADRYLDAFHGKRLL